MSYYRVNDVLWSTEPMRGKPDLGMIRKELKGGKFSVTWAILDLQALFQNFMYKDSFLESNYTIIPPEQYEDLNELLY